MMEIPIIAFAIFMGIEFYLGILYQKARVRKQKEKDLANVKAVNEAI